MLRGSPQAPRRRLQQVLRQALQARIGLCRDGGAERLPVARHTRRMSLSSKHTILKRRTMTLE